jgi:hypothetical protein
VGEVITKKAKFCQSAKQIAGVALLGTVLVGAFVNGIF